MPPNIIAAFDQSLAGINEMIDALITAYTLTRTIYPKAETIMSLAHSLNTRADNQEALAQYLAVTIDRLAQIKDND